MSQIDDMLDTDAKRTVLVVEDNELNRETLCLLLEDDFEVLRAENGLVGLEQLEKHYQTLSLVLLDVFMPVVDGFEFLRRKAADSRYDTIPVIVTTASTAIDDERTCLELGATDFIVKPYDREIVANRVNNLIKLRESASIANLLKRDNVTGLCSKQYFYRLVEETFSGNPSGSYDMVCSDVDDFKELNDRYGEANCDDLLRRLAQRMREVMPGLVVAGRTGSDRFAFLLEHQEPGWEDALTSVAEGLSIAGLGVKFGIVENVDASEPITMICNKGITAIETIKDLVGVATARFNGEMHERQVMEQVIRETMEEALEERQFFICFQPKLDVQTGKAGGAEALVRWNHPELGLVSPDVFITLFERNGFIARLDMFVWEEACRQIRRLIDNGLPVVPISVNMSRLDFDVPDLPNRIAQLADAYGIDRSLLHLELTETAYSDSPETVTRMLEELKGLGFCTELDDFGSGYSSLSSLNTLPLDVMKLDMSLIRQATKLNDFRIVESVIKLGKTLQMETVVEGVDTAEEAARVSEIGCDFIQGYYYSKPLVREEFERYLEEEGAWFSGVLEGCAGEGE